MALFESYERRINQINKCLNDNGIALVISMGDGTSTSCNIVDFATFKEEIIRNNFKIIKCYISSDIPNFDKCMCAIIRKNNKVRVKKVYIIFS